MAKIALAAVVVRGAIDAIVAGGKPAQMTRDQAVGLSKSDWWKVGGFSNDEVAVFQLYMDCLCMNYGDFCLAVMERFGVSDVGVAKHRDMLLKSFIDLLRKK